MEESFTLSNARLIEVLRAGLAEGGSLKLEVKGASMFPSIREGDTVVVSPVSGGCICLGTVVVFVHRPTGKLLIHRVIGRKGGAYLIKGDTLFRTDGLAAGQDILGMVTNVLRRGGTRVPRSVVSRLCSVVLSRSRVFSCIPFFGKLLPLTCRVAVKKIIFPE
jgi:signal peptidase I